MKTNTLGFIGGGRITRIFLQAFKNKSMKFDSIFVFDPNEDVLESLQNDFPEINKTDAANCAKQDLVILAVHPPVMVEAMNNIKEVIDAKSVVLSLAPKISSDKMSEILPNSKIVRMIPNATSYINQGYNPVYFNHSFTSDEKKELMKLFGVLGHTFEVAENKLEGYAIISAMLPTYFWFQWWKMEEIAEKTDLTQEEAKETISKTLEYANDLFYRSTLTHDEVIDLIPVKPIGDHESEINLIYERKLMGLYEKIRSVPAAEAV